MHFQVLWEARPQTQKCSERLERASPGYSRQCSRPVFWVEGIIFCAHSRHTAQAWLEQGVLTRATFGYRAKMQ